MLGAGDPPERSGSGFGAPQLALVLGVAFVFAAGIAYMGGLAFDPVKDEEQFWSLARAFAADWPPGLEDLRSYPEPMTPIAFLLWAGLEHLLGIGIAGARLLTLVASLAALALIGLRPAAPGAERAAPVLAATALLLYPYWIPLSMLVYTDVPAALFVLLGFWLYLRDRHLAAALLFAVAIGTRQYTVTFPLAIAGYEIVRALRSEASGWSRGVPYLVAAATLGGWVAFFGGLGPAPGMQEWPRHQSAMSAFEPSYLFFYLGFLGLYFVVPEFVLYRRWRTLRPRFDARIALILGFALVFFLIDPPRSVWHVGTADRALRFVIGYSDFAEGPRGLFYLGLTSLTVIRFARLDLGTWIILGHGVIMPFLWTPWEKYVMPVLATLWLLKAAGVLDETGDEDDRA